MVSSIPYCVQNIPIWSEYLIQSDTNNLHTIIQFQVFQSNTDLYALQLFLFNNSNLFAHSYMVSSN